MEQSELTDLLNQAVGEPKNQQLNLRIAKAELELLQFVQGSSGLGASKLIRAAIRQMAIDLVQDGECFAIVNLE